MNHKTLVAILLVVLFEISSLSYSGAAFNGQSHRNAVNNLLSSNITDRLGQLVRVKPHAINSGTAANVTHEGKNMSFIREQGPLQGFLDPFMINAYPFNTFIKSSQGSLTQENYTNFQAYTAYWLKLGRINANSSETIYMGFASNSTNLFNKVNVGEAPELSRVYGEYDDGQNVFVYYTNFTNFKGWVAGGKVSYSADDGLVASFNGPGYLVTDSSYGPGTGFVAGVSSIGDVDDVGYFDINQTVNGGTAWAGAFIRLACGYTYPDQWNASGEANGCGSAYGYFVNAEGIPGIYMVEILNRTSSVQSLNGMFSKAIRTDYPEYPARVGFDGVYSPLS
ncbi:MAG: hypothetical protein RAK20_06890, partial [Conexivisphaerales archaeon]|nr:hypothetical protein [Conexivisphaerales archaeon]